MLVIKIRQPISRGLGAIGTILLIAIFVKHPSFPTPDKLVVFLVFVFMCFGQAIEAIKRFVPFVLLILVYESFRSIADQLNSRVDYLTGPHFDRALFGNLPTVYLQNWLWHGHVQWYDFVLYLPYFLHFAVPLGLGVLVWKTRDHQFWRVMNTYLFSAFAAFLTFLLFPAAPPWLASQNHYIQPIIRISSQVWASLGIHDFPSFYNHISPNPVASVPSLHAVWATLLPIFVYKLYGRRWALLAAVYPFLIFVGTIYDGEHYAFDIIVGIIYALLAYVLVPRIMKYISNLFDKKTPKRRLKAASHA